MRRPITTTVLGAATLCLLATAPGAARGEIPQGFDIPTGADDYRASYSLTTGVWGEDQVDQVSLHHRLSLQIPIWGASAGVQLPFTNLVGEYNQSAMGNFRLFLQYFNRFEWSRRAAITFGGGLDLYLPTASSIPAQDPRATLLASPTAGDTSLSAPDLTFGLRPRLHLTGEAWIFSLQLVGGAAIHFVDSETHAAFEWGVNFSIQATRWLALIAEATGVSWIGASPGWCAQRVVNLGGGARFLLPAGFTTGLWLRVPVTGLETDALGDRLFLGVDLTWQRERRAP